MSKTNISIDSLYDNIENDFAWRRKELHIFSKKIPSENNVCQRALLRAGTTLLYAHWEGFIRISTSYYLQHVSMQSLKHKDLQTQIVALCLKSKLAQLNTSRLEMNAKTIEFLMSELNEKAYVPYKNVINTKANLGFEVLKEIFFTIGLDISKYISKEDIIENLRDLRNNIAHGSNPPITFQVYNELHNEIIGIMTNIKEEIVNSAILKAYKKEQGFKVIS